MRLGDLEVHPISDGSFRLDGGAMFGTVPKVLWERRAPADDRNRIALGLNALLIITGHTRVLVDAGVGDKWSAKERDIFAIDHAHTLDRSLVGWLEASDGGKAVTVRSLPEREHIDVPVRESLIVELYSK